MTTLNIFTDGGSRGNPGPAACAFVVKNKTGKIIYQEGKFLGKTTNNLAEYEGVILAFDWLVKNLNDLLSIKKVNLYLDSKLIVNQLMGLYKIKNSKIREKVFLIKIKEKEINKKIYYYFIPREKNLQADRLVNETMDKALHESKFIPD